MNDRYVMAGRPSLMRNKLNCWELKKCGREPGGPMAAELGVCPAATADYATGVNSGLNGGRICWALTGTLCGGKVQGTFATKLISCLACEFYVLVKKQEGHAFSALCPMSRTRQPSALPKIPYRRGPAPSDARQTAGPAR